MKTLRRGVECVVFTLLVGGPALAALHTVNVNSGSFNPNNIEINEDDQIRWVHISGQTHTSTSGTPGDPDGIWNGTIVDNGMYQRTFNTPGEFPYFCTPHGFTGEVTVVAASGILDDPSVGGNVASLIALRQNSPNPFNAATQIEYSLDRDGVMQLSVFNILGQRVTTLVEGFRPGGQYTAHWDGRDHHGNEIPSGIYFARLATSDVVMTRKMVLLR